MPKVVGIKFKTPKTYWFEAGDYEYTLNCGVIVETVKGMEYGICTALPAELEDEKLTAKLKPIVRLANDKDDAQAAQNEKRLPATKSKANEIIMASGLNMKMVDCEYTFDGSKLIVYFTADSRVDFRDLVRTLAREFHVRIELKQIGSRDECALKGGIAPCGRACCCSDHMPDFAHVTIKMAKNQNLSLNPGKISGLCGRLMCCLAYENDHYVETNKRMPKVGSAVTLKDGTPATCIGINQLKETVRVKVEKENSFELSDLPLADIRFKGRGNAAESPETPESEEIKGLED